MSISLIRRHWAYAWIEEQIKYDEQSQKLAPYSIHNFKDYIGAFYNIVIENLNRNNLTVRDWERSVSINTLNFSPAIRRLSITEKTQLIESGKEEAIRFLRKKY